MLNTVVNIPLPGNRFSTPSGSQNALAAESQESFLAGPENRLVEAVVRAVLENDARMYSPIVLHGVSGTGKSHLALGLADAWKSGATRRKVVVTSAVDFARNLAEAVETQSIDDFRAEIRLAEFAVFEDLDHLVERRSEKISAQEELLHAIDSLMNKGAWIIVTSAASPATIENLLPGLKSRLAAGLTVELVPPGVEARREIIRNAATRRNIELSDKETETLAESFKGSAPELIGAIAQLEATRGRAGRKIDAKSVRRLLDDRRPPKPPTISEIASAAAKQFGARLTDLRGPSRQRIVVNARDVAIHLSRTLNQLSLEQIGKYFGGRDHTTIMHSLRKIEGLLKTDPNLRNELEQLAKRLKK